MTKRILVADDEPSVCQLLELVLKSEGYEVIIAYNGDQLVRLAQGHMPDLLLIDLMMPQIDGYEAIRQLRNDTRTAHLPMIILTAKSTPTDLVIGLRQAQTTILLSHSFCPSCWPVSRAIFGERRSVRCLI